MKNKNFINDRKHMNDEPKIKGSKMVKIVGSHECVENHTSSDWVRHRMSHSKVGKHGAHPLTALTDGSQSKSTCTWLKS